MKLKTADVGGKTYAEVAEGKPVYVHDDGKELGFDAPQAMQRISGLNGEAKGHREKVDKLEAALKAFEGITDPAAALKALETIKSLDEGKLITAGKVDEIKSQARRQIEEQLAEAKKQHTEEVSALTGDRDKYKKLLHGEKIGNAFSRSKYIQEKIAVPVDLFQSMFEKHFEVDDNGKIIGRNGNGQPIGSRSNFGENADFEEAIETLVGAYPHKDAILKGTGNSGMGARQANGGGQGQGGPGLAASKTISRKDFDALPPIQKQLLVKDHKIIDA